MPPAADAVVQFLHLFEDVAKHEDFALVQPMIDERAVFRINDRGCVGLPAIQAVFEKSLAWRHDGEEGSAAQIHAAPAFYARPAGVCVDLARLAVETLWVVAPAAT